MQLEMTRSHTATPWWPATARPKPLVNLAPPPHTSMGEMEEGGDLQAGKVLLPAGVARASFDPCTDAMDKKSE
jgi:hypothetical protein